MGEVVAVDDAVDGGEISPHLRQVIGGSRVHGELGGHGAFVGSGLGGQLLQSLLRQLRHRKDGVVGSRQMLLLGSELRLVGTGLSERGRSALRAYHLCEASDGAIGGLKTFLQIICCHARSLPTKRLKRDVRLYGIQAGGKPLLRNCLLSPGGFPVTK